MQYSTMSEIVVARVRDDILSGKLRPGVRLDQVNLTEELGVSLSPLREAFRRLEAQGYITIVPHRGAYVAEFSQEELEDIYLVRRNLEGLAAELAMDRLTDGDLQRWVDINLEYAEKWPNITRKGEPPADADDYKDEQGKFEKYFSPNPGTSH